VLGIFLGSEFNLPLALIFTGLVPFPLIFFFRQHKQLIILASLCLIALFGGAFCFQSSLPPVDESRLQSYNDQEAVEIKGIVSTDPEIKEKSTHLRLSAAEIKLDKGWQEV